MRDAIYFDDYETISDIILPLGFGCTLNMNIRIGGGGNDQIKEKLPFQSEYLYRNTKYSNRDISIAVKRKFFPYLSLEFKDDSDAFGKGKVQITHYDILGFREKVLEVDRLLANCFALKDDELIIPTNMNFQVISMPSDSTVLFMPTVIQYNDGTKSPGVMMDLANRFIVNVPVRTWKAFVYYIMTADLYGWGASILSGYTEGIIGHNVQDMRSVPNQTTVQDVDPHVRYTGFKGDKKGFFDN